GGVATPGQPERRRPALVLDVDPGVAGEAVPPVGPDHLQVRRPDVTVVPVRDREHAGRPPGLVHRPDRERARADAVDPVSGLDRRAVGDALADRVHDDRHVLDRKAEHGQLGTLVAEPQSYRVGPGRRDLIAEDGGDRPADGADVLGDGLHAGLRVEAGALGQRLALPGAASAWWVHGRHITR